MRIVSFCVFFVLSYLPGNGQTVKAVRLSDSLLQVDIFKAAITSYDFPVEIKQLQTKALTNLKGNPEWAGKYLLVRVKEGDQDIKFLDAYGLTKAEFEKMLTGFRNGQMAIYSDTLPIAIKKNNNLITFQGSKKLSLFNFLKIDTKNNIVYYDNLKTTRELEIDGKFYAPILKGIESHMSEEVSSLKLQSDITYFGYSVGTNKDDTRPTLCLIYGKPTKGQVISNPSFLIITIL
jgi:hypothetical protein